MWGSEGGSDVPHQRPHKFGPFLGSVQNPLYGLRGVRYVVGDQLRPLGGSKSEIGLDQICGGQMGGLMSHIRGGYDVPRQRGGLTPTNLGHFWVVSKIAYMVSEWSDTSWVTSWGTWEARNRKSDFGQICGGQMGGGSDVPHQR